MAKLYFRYGAMGSSKTANALMVRYNYEERGKNALMLKPSTDTRDGVRTIRSRCGLEAPCELIEELDIEKVKAHVYDCLIVDEAQFLTREQVEQLFENGYSTKGSERGLGLARVKQIADKYNLDIQVENQEINKKNRIVFRLVIKK